MSKVKISGNASGTGTLTITAPDTDTDRSLTLPDTAGEFVTADASGNVGIGTGSPASPLTINASTNNYNGGIRINNNAGTATSAITMAGTNLYLSSNASSDHMIIDSNGFVRMSYQPAFSAKLASTTSSGVVVFDTATRNVGNGYSTSTGRFTAPVTGNYLINTTVLHASTTTTLHIYLRVNGSSVINSYQGAPAVAEAGASLSYVLYLASGDYVEVYATNGAYGSNYSSFSGHLIG